MSAQGPTGNATNGINPGRFDGKVAMVTGGASGIGLAIARRLVAEGGRLLLADLNEASLLGAAEALGDGCCALTVDVRREDQVAEAVATAVAQFGSLDLGFNCAGLGAFGEIVELTEQDWDTVIDICLKGVFLAIKHQARAMIDAQGRPSRGPGGERGKGGAIVNIASLNSHVPMYGGAAYTAAKAGVEMLSRNAALELAPHRIRVNTVSPGLTDTPLTAGFREVAGAEQAFLARIPMERWGTPDDMAAAALFLASEDAGYITGSNLFVDGGWETTGYPDLRPFRDALTTDPSG